MVWSAPVVVQVVMKEPSASATVRASESAKALLSSRTSSVRVTVVSAATGGSVTVGASEVSSSKVTPESGGSWDHAYIRASSSGSVAEPASVKVEFSMKVRSGPASAVGGLLGTTCGASPVRRMIWTPSSPDAATAA